VNKFRKLASTERLGFQCKYYDPSDAKFTTPYDWKFCHDMEVGQTYELHWPHSSLGACGTPNQYQTPFYDGVFCHNDLLNASNIPSQVGVQAQVFTVVNDEAYYYPDLLHGMIVDGEMGTDVSKYTGSTTGTKVNNEICSGYSPITWQVDRKCHLISASSLDKLCADMLSQRDDMTDDLHPHGSRELVLDTYSANNHQGRFLRSAFN
jgi:Delta carbonic anhydrase